MPVKKARALRDRLLIVGFVVMLLAYVYQPFFYLGGVIACSCLIPHFLYNKCPHCGKQFGRNEGDFCQHCGKRIDG